MKHRHLTACLCLFVLPALAEEPSPPPALPVEAGAEEKGAAEASANETNATAQSAPEKVGQVSARPAPRVYPPEHEHRLDIGGTFGVNNAGGFGPLPGYGLEADLRLFKYLSVGAGVGQGLWDYRFTGHLRLYPAGIENSVFVQGSYAFNTGGPRTFFRANEPMVQVDLPPASTVNATLGLRKDLPGRGWVAVQAGWAFALPRREPAPRDERPLNEAETASLRVSAPGGLVLGVSGGFSVL